MSSRILQQHGWELWKVSGSHHKFRKAGQRPLIVPIHGNTDLKKGTLTGLMKQAGLTEGDL